MADNKTNSAAYRVLVDMARSGGMRKQADWKADLMGGLKNIGSQASEWLSNPENLKNLAVGGGTGLGLYALSGQADPKGKHRGLRFLGSALAGGLAGWQGDKVRAGAQALWEKTPMGQKMKARRDAAAAQAADAERARNTQIATLQHDVAAGKKSLEQQNQEYAKQQAQHDAGQKALATTQSELAGARKSYSDVQARQAQQQQLHEADRQAILNEYDPQIQAKMKREEEIRDVEKQIADLEKKQQERNSSTAGQINKALRPVQDINLNKDPAESVPGLTWDSYWKHAKKPFEQTETKEQKEQKIRQKAKEKEERIRNSSSADASTDQKKQNALRQKQQQQKR